MRWATVCLAAVVGLMPAACGTTSPATPTRTASAASALPTADPAGWSRVFSDDFTGAALSKRWVSYDGQPSGDPAGWFDPAHVTVSGGVLTIRGAYQEARQKWVTGGVSTQHSLKQTYGKYEVRFRAARGRGIAYAMLLLPVDDRWPPAIEFAEDKGDRRDRLYTTLYGAGGSRIEHSVEGDFTEWHVAGVEWTPGRVAYTLDGEVWATLSDESVPGRPMALALQTQAWYCGHSWQKCPDSTTPNQVDLQVDWVVAYARRSA